MAVKSINKYIKLGDESHLHFHEDSWKGPEKEKFVETILRCTNPECQISWQFFNSRDKIDNELAPINESGEKFCQKCGYALEPYNAILVRRKSDGDKERNALAAQERKIKKLLETIHALGVDTSDIDALLGSMV